MCCLGLIQFWQIFKKNFILGWRSRELIYEVLLPLLTGVLMVVKNVIFPIQFLAPIIVALAINTCSRSLLIRLVEEKNSRYKEVQKIMGLSSTAYFTAWYFSALIRTFISAVFFLILPLTIVTNVEINEQSLEILEMSDYLGFWDILYSKKVKEFLIAYALYVVAATNQVFAIAPLFSNPKLAGEFSTFLTTLTALLSFLVFSPSFIETPFYFIAVSLSPQACIAFAYIGSVKNPIYHENFEIANNPYTLQYPIDVAITQMGTLIGFYMIIYLYLETVTPNEYGIALHPLIFPSLQCCQKKKRSNKISHKDDKSLEDIQNDVDNNKKDLNDLDFKNTIKQDKEEIKEQNDKEIPIKNIIKEKLKQGIPIIYDKSSAVYHQPFENIRNGELTVEIDSLMKEFGNFRAVNEISLNLYNKNIFCLLGHNGSGKTTTISLLTGLIEKSKGSVKYFGKNLESNIKEIRKSLGICTQKEVLYEEMTFEEHLYFIGRIKGISRKNMSAEVEKVIEMTKTEKERKKKSKQLSGGNKRKLSLCMALIGGSKIVFLDEPTSGIDAISRRAIWEILDSVRSEDRTIVLTTHHLDEAEVLADRIGILAKGKLLAVGNNEFMKKNFGIGYTLSVYPDLNQNQEKQEQTLHSLKEIQEENGSQKNLEFKNSNLQKIQFTIEQKAKIIEIIEEKIPDAVVNPQSNMNSLIFMVPFQAQKHFVELFEKLEKQEGFLINLEMNSLEDAFVNIGMDEDKFFKKDDDLRKSLAQIQADIQVKADAKYTYFDDIKAPECLSKPPVYRFRTQFTACYLRKFYCTIRNFTNYVSFFVPLFLMILGSGVMVNTPEEGPGKLVLLGIFFGIAYSFNGGIYIVQPVQEREENLKYAMNVMGCRVIPFWLGTFAFDFTVYMLTVLIFLFSARDNGYTYITDYEGKIFMIMLVFGFSFITFSYMCGFILFSKSLSAMKGFPAINFFVVFILPWALLGVFYYLNYEGYIDETNKVLLEKICILVFFIYSPLYVLSQCFQHISTYNQEYFQLPFYSYSSDTDFYILVLLLQFIFYSTITYMLEQKKYTLIPRDRKRFKNLKIHKIKDEQVNIEKERVYHNSKAEKLRLLQDFDSEKLNIDPEIQKKQILLEDDKDKIVVRNLWKKYDSNDYVALKDVSYGVKKGEIMGLLGPNGAGKSTSFNILTALIPRSMGSVSIKDIQVNRGIMDIYQDVGICPQFDCVWTSLTPKEHLYLFGRMKGLTGSDLSQAVNYFLEVTQLTDFVKTKAGNLSGGNKRKLCVACALIGGPDIQFFDEPSTGVDPIARRFLWNTLKQGAKLRNSAIVLTTHTMLEAESLCTKIGILINGQLQCLGTPQQLRNKYGDGYTFTIKVNSEEENDKFKEELLKIFPKMKEIPEKRDFYYAYQVGTQHFSFYEGYQLCEKLKKENIILDFSINQCTLEQVFVRFSKFQKINPQ